MSSRRGRTRRRSQDDDATAAPEHATGPKREGLSGVLCVAGRNELDETAASLLVHLLRAEHSVRVDEALPAEALASSYPREWSFGQATLACLSLISTTSPARARYLVRRLHRRAPRARVVVGFWGLAPGELPVTVAAIAGPDVIVATSLRDAVTALHPHLATAAPYRVVGG